MRKSLFSAAAVSALLFTIASNAAFAQVAPPAAAQLAAPTREEIDRRPQATAPRSARLTVDGDIERAPCALDSPAYADIKVTITEAQFNNLQGVSPEELKASYASLLGPDRPISTICTIRDAAATELRRKGYLAAVQVPVQRIENGVVRFEVLFAKIVAIRVRGDAGKAEGLLAGYLKHLTEEKVFNRFVAERYLLLSRDLPGYEVRLALKPAGGAPGELVGEVSVTRSPIDVSASLQNFSSRSSGRWTGAVAAQAYGLLGGDRLSASLSSTTDFREQQIAQIGYDTRLGSEGLTWSGNFTYAWSKPDLGAAGAAGVALKARTLFATGELRYPIVRSQALSIVGAGGMDYLNQTVAFYAAGTKIDLSRDHLRVGFLRLDMDAADIAEQRVPMWRASGSVELRKGLDILDASPRIPPATPLSVIGPSRREGDPTSTLVRASASVELNLGKGFWIAATPRAQYAFDPLFSFEEMSAGNYSIGRGYDPGVITGDSGVGSGFELRMPRLAPLPKVNLSLQPFAFTDVMWVWNRGIPLPANPDFIASVGAGVRAMLNNRFRIDGTIAVPLKAGGLQTRNRDPRFLVSLSSKLWPWDN
ncbi:ShlB/FhaC/HecB family hemolysin secretion/activation protein [Sphingomonas sp. SRS2]|uniref:ShlB/FhaC/HecB family hemolysin secretion/activation protein n=1 Tax=Sphingomonas sp. SRS2 TaxID=133190 RepID=UPI000618441B|nr:ShlB/FhaC/HecB family hemolysin secretion/activation protein [Sphingomonas sp. SRS2]KKC27578.1 peptide transporter [Sphingomonas sp. SRS2]